MNGVWGIRGALIESGQVVSVDPNTWTCVVQTEHTARKLRDCLIGGLYLHPAGGEGIYAMPEVGAMVWVCTPSEGDTRPFLLLGRPVPDAVGSCHMNRPLLQPGDMAMVSQDGSGVMVRRGGSVEVFGTALCRTFYLPDHRMHTISQHVRLDVFGGSDTWEVFREEEDPEGHKGTRRHVAYKVYADDPAWWVESMIGSSVETDVVTDPIAGWLFYDSGETDHTETLAVGVNGAGDLGARTTGSVTLRTKQMSVQVDSDQTLSTYRTAGQEGAVLLGTDFLTQLQKVLTELVAVGVAAGVGTPETTVMLGQITSALSTGAPYLTKSFKAE